MGHGTDKHLEHAEHVQHHAHDPFDRRVAVTMAMIAAALAGVTLLSHRGHTETLRLATEANIKHTEASDQWNFYQAKNIRSHEFQSFLTILNVMAKTPGKEKEEEASRAYWIKQIDKYEGKKGEDGQRSSGELIEIKTKAEKLQADGIAKEHQSHEVHAAVNYLDYGHLAIEMALVLCSVAVLTKQKSFWISGILIAVLGIGVASVGMSKWLAVEAHDAGHAAKAEHKSGSGH